MARTRTTLTAIGLAALMVGAAGSVVLPTLTASSEFATGTPMALPTPPVDQDPPVTAAPPRRDTVPSVAAPTITAPAPVAAPSPVPVAVPVAAAPAAAPAPVAGAAPTASPVPSATPAATAVGRYFAVDSPFNTAATGSPTDPNSAAMMSALLSVTPVSNLVQFGVPVYQATSATPTQRVQCTADWGTCPLTGVDVPLDDSFRPNVGSDGAMVVVDAAKGVAYEFWRAAHSASGWTTQWGGVESLSGSGWTGVATATGASRLGGVVLISELQQGFIPHALAVQSSHVCSATFRAPAVKTDGWDTSAACIPAGSRIRLDPTVDLTTLTMTPAQRAIATALQTYGAYVVDSGSAPLSVSFQLAPDASGTNPGSAYAAMGLTADYQALSDVPWSRVSVVSNTP